MKIFKNSEGIKEYNIDPNWWKNRLPGLSVFYRVKNEGEFIKPSILSIIDHVDEVIVGLQPCEDNTREQIESIESSKIKILDYPFKLMPNGKGFKDQDISSVHNKAYFYNWTLSKTNYDWVIKWDGDMIALPIMYEHLKDRNYRKGFYGYDIVKMEKDGDWYLSETHPISNAAPSGMFRIRKDIMYLKGNMTHRFHNPDSIAKKRVNNAYIHLKWCKRYFNDIWKENWEKDDLFRNLCIRAKPGKIYKGVKPKLLVDCIESDMGGWDTLKKIV
jgi:hypothetical protein